MIHMFTYHRPNGWKWRFAITEASDDSGRAGTVVLQRHLGHAGIFRWDTVEDVCSNPNDIPGVSWLPGKTFTNEHHTSFTRESVARLVQSVEAYLSVSPPDHPWASHPPSMLRTVATGRLIDEAADKFKRFAPAVELNAEERELLRALRHDAPTPEHDDQFETCETCERRRRTIALLDRLIA